MYEEGDISIEPVNAPDGADAKTYAISGNPYDIIAPGEYFRLPVEIEIPYDPSRLPENRTEVEVFPVYYFEGVWHRVNGEVDTQSKTIRIATLHNGIWDWAWDKVDNWAGPEKAFFCDNSNVENLSQARENAEQARLELLFILEDAKMKVEEIDVPTDHVVQLVLDEMKSEGTVFVLEGLAEVFRGKTAIKFIFGGKSAVIHIGGTKIATLLSGGAAAIKALDVVGTAIVFYKQGDAIGETSAQIYRIAAAYKRFKEAKAIVWGLENGCQVLSMPPEYAETLKEYYAAIPIDQTIDGPRELDLDFSLYKDDITGLLGLTPEETSEASAAALKAHATEVSANTTALAPLPTATPVPQTPAPIPEPRPGGCHGVMIPFTPWSLPSPWVATNCVWLPTIFKNINIYYFEYPGSFQFDEQHKSLVAALEADGYSECQIGQHPYSPEGFIAPSDVPYTLFWGCEDTLVNWRVGIEEPNLGTLIVVLENDWEFCGPAQSDRSDGKWATQC